METQGLNLFIVDDNKLMANDLRLYLQNKFGLGIRISTFENGESCLEQVDKKTNIVILDYFMEGKNGLDILKLIKAKNPKTEVIMLSSNEDLVLAIESFRSGATDYIVKGHGALRKVAKQINYILTAPLRLIVREFGVSKYMAGFFLTFIVMGIVIFSVLHFMK